MCERFEVAEDDSIPETAQWVARWVFLGWHQIPVIGEQTIGACDWLRDPALPGRWEFQRDLDRMGYLFYIEDADVAFAFKMRWA